MTSSLVGSEMCIRDRREGKGEGRGSNERSSTNGRSKTYAHLRLCRRPKSCLLYTSDAADDM
eukprot:10648908-Prorocentrum_lima.AAC.1